MGLVLSPIDNPEVLPFALNEQLCPRSLGNLLSD